MLKYTLAPEDAHKAVVGSNHITVLARAIHVACLNVAAGYTPRGDFHRAVEEIVGFKTHDRRYRVKWKAVTSGYRSGIAEYMHERVYWYHLNGTTEFELTVA